MTKKKIFLNRRNNKNKNVKRTKIINQEIFLFQIKIFGQTKTKLFFTTNIPYGIFNVQTIFRSTQFTIGTWLGGFIMDFENDLMLILCLLLSYEL